MPMHWSWRNRRSTLLLRTSFLLCQRTILSCLAWVIVQPLLLGKGRRTRHPRRGAFNNNSTSSLLLPGVIAAPRMLRCLRPTRCRRWHKRSGLHVHLWTATPSSTCSCSNVSMSVHAECQHEDFHDHGACVASCRSRAIWVELEAAA